MDLKNGKNIILNEICEEKKKQYGEDDIENIIENDNKTNIIIDNYIIYLQE